MFRVIIFSGEIWQQFFLLGIMIMEPLRFPSRDILHYFTLNHKSMRKFSTNIGLKIRYNLTFISDVYDK